MPLKFSAVAVVSVLSVVLAGCSSNFDVPASSSPTSTSLGTIQGNVHGGQQPIAGSHVYVYSANSSGANSASVSLLKAFSTGSYPTAADNNGNYYVTSDVNGGFSLTGEYVCTSGSQVYLYASGGNPGGGVNTAVGLLAILGQCPAVGTFAATIPFVTVNEVSTIAAAYAMAGFAIDATHVSSSSTTLAKTGLANAFANAANLVSVSTAVALTTTPAGNGIVPQSEINTLANILAACVNSASSSATGCSSLFVAATSDGTSTGAKAVETATAAINIAHHPAARPTLALVSNQNSNSPFSPVLGGSPIDFTVALDFTGGSMFFPEPLAIDNGGNVWVAGGTLTELSPSGIAVGFSYPRDTFQFPTGLAIDLTGNIWKSDYYTGLTKISNTGTLLSPTGGYTGGSASTSGASGVAVDPNGFIWAANTTLNGIFKVSSAGVPQSPALGYGIGNAGYQDGIAIDSFGNAWASVPNDEGVVKLSNSGVQLSPTYGFQGGASAYGIDADQIAIDSQNNVWIAPQSTTLLRKLSNSGAELPPYGFTGGGITYTRGIAIDGSGNVWLTDNSANSFTGNSITEFSNSGVALSPTSGFHGGGLNSPVGIGVDGSGNVWVSNSVGSSVSEFVGAATPVVTPIAAGPGQSLAATVITSVSAVVAAGTQTITVTGTGFGNKAGYTGTSLFFAFRDDTKGWQAGYGGDLVYMTIASWTDTQIVISGFSNYYGAGYVLTNGDHATVTVYNAQTSNGPSNCSTVVVGAGATTCN